MNSLPRVKQLVYLASMVFFLLAALCLSTAARGAGVRFQRPGDEGEQSERVKNQFRRPGVQVGSTPTRSSEPSKKSRVVRVQDTERPQPAARRKSTVFKRSGETRTAHEQSAKPIRPAKATQLEPEPAQTAQPSRRNLKSGNTPAVYEPVMETALELSSYGCDVCDGPCTCEAGCGCPEPSCGICEPGCGIGEPSCGCNEPSCGICEPSCGVYEPGCGIAEPSCGCGQVDCGTCCARPGPDYWCFPICLPRFKDLSAFVGVQGFRGPRDFANNRSDSNFGFNEGFNLSGRAPLVGLLFPQLSYQLGYRAVQSRLHGTSTASDDRSQQFVTAGLFRRVNTGVQFGLVWDLLQDDLDEDIDLHQLRYEISLKSPLGREIGFFATSSTNDALSNSILWETTDQYAAFYRWRFGNGYESRLWGGATGDGEGIFGGEFYAPLTNRWALQSGFNYQGTDEADGLAGVSEESWNIGINMVWHLGKTAKRGCRSPYRPMFSVADNGWMLVDQAQ
ncbi:MAG: DUF6666 family protein [Planctomycetota bacterium]